jgi:hypothetical protein
MLLGGVLKAVHPPAHPCLLFGILLIILTLYVHACCQNVQTVVSGSGGF